MSSINTKCNHAKLISTNKWRLFEKNENSFIKTLGGDSLGNGNFRISLIISLRWQYRGRTGCPKILFWSLSMLLHQDASQLSRYRHESHSPRSYRGRASTRKFLPTATVLEDSVRPRDPRCHRDETSPSLPPFVFRCASRREERLSRRINHHARRSLQMQVQSLPVQFLSLGPRHLFTKRKELGTSMSINTEPFISNRYRCAALETLRRLCPLAAIVIASP